MHSRLVLDVDLLDEVKIINRKENVCITCLRQVFLTVDFNVKWRSETFDEINVIIVQSIVVLNMNTEVFRIHDMNTLHEIGDLNTMTCILVKCGASLAMGPTCQDLSGPTCP